jgi:hypothetical protein
MILFILAATGLTDDSTMYILHHKVGGGIGSIVVDELVSVFLMCAIE